MPEYLKSAVAQPEAITRQIVETVSEILHAVAHEGIVAVRRYSERLDGWNPPHFLLSQTEIAQAAGQVDDTTKAAIHFAQQQVRGFAQRQRETLVDFEAEPLPGFVLGQRQIPINMVGSYSPGGRYPLLASSIMTVQVPRVAGVRTVVACAPPRPAGGIHPPQLYAMATSGADAILCLGGVQALAALAFGIEGLAPVDMIVGAGNAYVAEAKRQLFGTVGIDLLAGPTEILIIADESANPVLVAADLLGQAEHGPTSPAILVTTSRPLGEAVAREVERWLTVWPTAEVAGIAWRDRGQIVVCADDEEAAQVADQLAPEHLEVQTRDPKWYLRRLTNYGSLFLGEHATVVFSDKAIGTNHVLPTGRAARYTGGLWVGKFIKTVTYQYVTAQGSTHVAAPAATIAEAEYMRGHAVTARLRLTGWASDAQARAALAPEAAAKHPTDAPPRRS